MSVTGDVSLNSASDIVWGGDTNLYRLSANILATDDRILVSRGLDTDIAFDARITGDNAPRFQAQAGGKLLFGDGTSAADTNLYRSAANTLKTDDSFHIEANADTVFRVQDAADAAMFTVDSNGAPTVKIGDTSTVNNPVIFVLDHENSDPVSADNGAMYYNTTDNKFRCYQNGSWIDCVGAGGGSGTLQDAYDASGTPATIVTTSSTKDIIIQSGTGFDSTSVFQVQNAASTDLFTVDSSNGGVYIGTDAGGGSVAQGQLRLWSTGTNGAGSRLFFGDGNTSANHNVWIGESGTGDSDALHLLGDEGISLAIGSNTTVFSLDSEGHALFQARSDADDAFRVQNAAGTIDIFTIDTAGDAYLDVDDGGGANGESSIGFNGRAFFGYDGDTQDAFIQGAIDKGIKFYVDDTLEALDIDSDGTSTFNGHVLPGTDDTYDLGSDTQRWRDLYLGPATLNIGTSNIDQGTIGYDTTTNNMMLGTTNGGVTVKNDTDTTSAFAVQNAAGDDLFKVDAINGNLSVGTTEIGDVQGWTTDSDLVPVATPDVHFSKSIYDWTLNRVFTVGHNEDTGVYDIYYNDPDPTMTGDMVGNWAALPKTGLPSSPISDITSYNGWLYVAISNGGTTSIYYTNNYTTWTAATDAFFGNNVALTGAIVAANGYLYLFRSSNDADPGYNTIYYTIDGGTGAPTLTSITNGPVLDSYFAFNGGITTQQAVAMGDRIFVYDSEGAVLAHATQTGADLGAFSTVFPSSGGYGAALASSPSYCDPSGGNCNLWLVGGGDDSEIWYANASSPGTWNQSFNTLPRDITYGGAVGTDPTTSGGEWILYAMGGKYNTLANNSEEVYSAYSPDWYGGETDGWNTNIYPLQDFTPGVNGGSALLLNNKIFYIGGLNSNELTVEDEIYSTTLNPNGSIGAWSINSTLPQAKAWAATTTAGGRAYMFGGSDTNGGAGTTSAYIGRLNSSGTLSFTTTGATVLPQALTGASAISTGKRVYVLGGGTTWLGGVVSNTRASSPLGADGSISFWSDGPALPAVRAYAMTTTANGYVYVIGGSTGVTNGQNTVYYSKIQSDGTLGAWATNGNTLPAAVWAGSAVTINGYIYVTGGLVGATAQSNVYYAKLNANGSTGTWQTASNGLPEALHSSRAVAANGYIYNIGGAGASGTITSTSYASTQQRTQFAGSLDLVGVYDANQLDMLGNGSVGGSLTAGNTTVVGSLGVYGDTSFSQNVSVANNLTVGGGASFDNGMVVNGGTSSDIIFNLNATGAGDFKINNSSGQKFFHAYNGGSGLVGIGLLSGNPGYQLDVQRTTGSNGYVAQIYNTSTSNAADGLLINLGVANASRTASNYFIGFAGAGTVAGKVQGTASGVTYTTTAADYAEYFLAANPEDKPQLGEIVALSTTKKIPYKEPALEAKL